MIDNQMNNRNVILDYFTLSFKYVYREYILFSIYYLNRLNYTHAIMSHTSKGF